MTEKLIADVEIREVAGKPTMLHATILTEGHMSRGGRSEVVSPGALEWPSTGIAVRAQHGGAEEVRAIPVRDGNAIRIEARATPALVEAVNGGARHASVEMHVLTEFRTPAGAREVSRAYLSGAALTSEPEYSQTISEIRSKNRRRVWL